MKRMMMSRNASLTVSCVVVTFTMTLAYSLSFPTALSMIDDGPTSMMALLSISTGWVEHSNSSGTWYVPRSIETCSSIPKLWAVESIILKLIFSKRSFGSTPQHVARILSIASFSCARFSFLSLAMGRVGNAINFPFMATACTMNDPTPFFFELSSWYVMTDSSDAIILSTMPVLSLWCFWNSELDRHQYLLSPRCCVSIVCQTFRWRQLSQLKPLGVWSSGSCWWVCQQ